MWFTQEQFALCSSLRHMGLEPRFEVGDLVARGFADLGFEEFQVLPGPSILSLTAGTLKPLAEDHRQHFFWIPSVDESIELLEARGAIIQSCLREDNRHWKLSVINQVNAVIEITARSLHEALLRALVGVLRDE